MVKFNKKIILIICALLLFSTVLFSSCKNPYIEKTDEKYTVTYTASVGGYIDGETNQKVEKDGITTAVTAIADKGNFFVCWSDGNEKPIRQDFGISSDLNIVAYFSLLKVNVTYTADTGGFVNYGGLEGTHVSQNILYGEDTNYITAVPKDGYEFLSWSDGITKSIRKDINVTTEIDVVAYFKPLTYKIRYFAEEGGYIDGDYPTEALFEDRIKVKAIPYSGYLFAGWSDGISTSARDDLITKDLSVTARFKKLFDGDGTKENPFVISSNKEFQNMQYYPNAYYELSSDLNLLNTIYEPIFSESNKFQGKFDGNDHTIKNMSINTETNLPSLFGYVGINGEIANLKMTDVEINIPHIKLTDRPLCVGAIASVSFGKLSNIVVSGSIFGEGLNFGTVAIGGGWLGRPLTW